MTEPQVLATLTFALHEVVPEMAGEQLDPRVTLASLGCSSIDRAEIITITMERTRADVPLEAFDSGLTIEELVKIVSSHA